MLVIQLFRDFMYSLWTYHSNQITPLTFCARLDYIVEPLLNYTLFLYTSIIHLSLKGELLRPYSFTYCQISTYRNRYGNGSYSGCKTTRILWEFHKSLTPCAKKSFEHKNLNYIKISLHRNLVVCQCVHVFACLHVHTCVCMISIKWVLWGEHLWT